MARIKILCYKLQTCSNKNVQLKGSDKNYGCTENATTSVIVYNKCIKFITFIRTILEMAGANFRAFLY